MKQLPFFTFLLLLILLIACSPAVETAVLPTATPIATKTIEPTAVLLTTVPTPLPTLPALIPAVSLSGYFPERIDWSLDTELPEAETAVPIFSQPAQIDPLTAVQAAATAEKFGFEEPLYVEFRTGFSVAEAAAMGMFVTFDGTRSLALGGRPFTYNDASQQTDMPDLPFAQAAPIAEQFLSENGWLTFPYETAESDQGEGVLFLPILDGVLLTTPAYGVRVTGDGGVSRMSIYLLDDLTSVGSYPIMSAETAWQQVQADPNQPGIFYQIDPPALETAVSTSSVPAVPNPPIYHRLPAPGETGSVYNNIWVYRPLAGDGPPLIQSNDYLRINGDSAMLDALAAETDYLVKLTGTVQESIPGVQTLNLTDWELIPEAGGLPIIYGRIVPEEGQIFLDDWANQQTYLLPDAPPELQIEVETAGAEPVEAAVYGLPQDEDGVSQIDWQQITILPTAEETILPRPTEPMEAVSVQSVKLVYLRMLAHVSGLEDNLYFPVWQFTGLADNGERVTMWVTAVVS